MSRPPWARGLKLAAVSGWRFDKNVAPPVGAWIETSVIAHILACIVRRAPRGRVD